MKNRSIYFSLIIGAALIIGAVLLPGSFATDLPRLVIHSSGGDVEVQVEVVKTEAEKARGLMRRTHLSDDRGMLFLFESGRSPEMWMKNMLISLDMIFIGPDFRINYIERGVPPCRVTEDNSCPRYHSEEKSTIVLEVPAGYTKKNGIDAGDKVELLDVAGF